MQRSTSLTPCDELSPAVVAELADRWRRARVAALRACLPTTLDAAEAGLVAAALAHDAEAALRRVHDHGLALGKSFRAFHRIDVPLADLVAILPRLGTPCLADDWSRTPEPAYTSTRSGCAAAAWHSRACDYWREAIGGLVLGLTGWIHHARHESRGHGNARCVDVLYAHPRSPSRFGPIPDEVRAGLESVRRTARGFDSTFDVTFLGISENVLHYEIAPGSGPVRLDELVERGIRRRFPWLQIHDSTPRAVFVESP